MKKLFFIFFNLAIVLTITAAEPVFYREISVDKGALSDSAKEYTVQAVLFVPDGIKGIKLKDSAGKERGIGVVMKRGSRWNVYFNASPTEKLRLEYFNEKMIPKQVDLASGLLRIAKKYKGRPVYSIQEFWKYWQKAVPQGGGFVKRVYTGSNPFGASSYSLNKYSGFIKIPRDGKYFFYTASTDASFILIDGKMVAKWPGAHWVTEGLYGKHGGSIVLKKGVHRFEYLHANNRSRYYAIAAYRLPKRKKFQIIPESMFTTVLSSSPSELKDMQNRAVADFSWRKAATLEADKLQMYRVECNTNSEDGIKWKWGDGTKEQSGGKVHYFFKTGKYPVQLKSSLGSMKQDVELEYTHDLKLIKNRDIEKMISEILEQEKSIGIQITGYRFLANAILQYKLKKFADVYYKRLLERQKIVPPEVIFSYYHELILDKLLKHEQYEKAEQEFKRFLSKLGKSRILSLARLEYAKLLFYRFGRTAEASNYFKQVKESELPKKSILSYKLLEADIALVDDGYNSSVVLYGKMQSLSKNMNRRQRLIASGSLISVRNCIISKNYTQAMDYIERLEEACPEMRLNPDFMLLKALTLKHIGQPRRAEICLRRVLLMKPSTRVEVKACLELAEYYHEQGRLRDSEKLLKKIISEAPRSHEAVAANRLLSQINNRSVGK